MHVKFAIEPDLSCAEFTEVLKRSGLAERRPADASTLEGMLRGASLIVTARVHTADNLLVGVARAITDGNYCTYLSDLAVDAAYQRQGIGRELVRQTHVAAGMHTNLILLAAPKAADYYPHIGMQRHDSCWVNYGSPRTSVSVQVATNEKAMGIRAAGELPDVGRFFDSISGEYAAAIHRCFPRYSEMLWALLDYLPRLESKQQLRILELGCGTGNLSVLLAQNFPTAKLTLVDLSQASLDQCMARLPESSSASWLTADMRGLNFADSSFDLILSTIAIHHLTSEEKQSLFRNCFRWLVPGGMLAFSDQFAGETQRVNQKHLENWQRISTAAGASVEEWEMWMQHQAAHDHHDSLSNQQKWLEDAGFVDIDCPWRYLLWTILQATKPATSSSHTRRPTTK